MMTNIDTMIKYLKRAWHFVVRVLKRAWHFVVHEPHRESDWKITIVLGMLLVAAVATHF